MISMAEELTERTLHYWQISQCWHGRSNRVIETGSAIHLLSDSIYGINPSRPLSRMAHNLQTEIIADLPRAEPTPGSNLLSFEELAKSNAKE